MQILYHGLFDPFSRKVRMYLKEVGLDFSLMEVSLIERERGEDFLRMNPSGDIPVLDVASEGLCLCGHDVICETIEDMMNHGTLFGGQVDQPVLRGEVRRLVRWFDVFFYQEVSVNLFGEKVLKRLMNKGGPNPRALQAGYLNLRRHLDYMKWLLEKRKWLAGEVLSLADLSAAAQISVNDYIGDIDWNRYLEVKEWYQLIKSRPSFRPLLTEYLSVFQPSEHYPKIDF